MTSSLHCKAWDDPDRRTVPLHIRSSRAAHWTAPDHRTGRLCAKPRTIRQPKQQRRWWRWTCACGASKADDEFYQRTSGRRQIKNGPGKRKESVASCYLSEGQRCSKVVGQQEGKVKAKGDKGRGGGWRRRGAADQIEQARTYGHTPARKQGSKEGKEVMKQDRERKNTEIEEALLDGWTVSLEVVT